MADNTTISIDSSTSKTGLAVFNDGTLTAHHLIDCSSIKNVDERSIAMGRSIVSYLDEYSPSVIYIEQPKGHQNIELVRKLSRILGVVMGWAATHGCYYEEVMPSVWRKYIPECSQGGKERAELKEESIRVCRELFGFEPLSDDEADAVLIGQSQINRYAGTDLF